MGSLSQCETGAHTLFLCLTYILQLLCCFSMLSYQWEHQTTIARLNSSLLNRGYLTWFDLDNMEGKCWHKGCTIGPSLEVVIS